jgi:uracil-DNA glycosylase
MWFEQMHPGWQEGLADQREWLGRMEQLLAKEPALAPKADLVMSAFAAAPDAVRVVIVGQDPYPTPGVAVGRSFAIADGPLPASLKNIFKELASDLGLEANQVAPNPDLRGWQSQGVMLLNRHLTTLEGEPGAHFKLGWESLTDAAVRHLVVSSKFLILVLWGNQAQKIKAKLDAELAVAGPRVAIIEGVHPSPLSARRGFFGSKPFSTINVALRDYGFDEINWLL